MHGHAVMGEQGVQEGAEHTPLWGPNVEDQRSGDVVYYEVEMLFPMCAIQRVNGKTKNVSTFDGSEFFLHAVPEFYAAVLQCDCCISLHLDCIFCFILSFIKLYFFTTQSIILSSYSTVVIY